MWSSSSSLALLLLFQAPVTGTALWDMDAASPSDAMAWRYTLYIAGVPTPLTGVVCTGAAPLVQCEAPAPIPTAPGTYVMTLTATDAQNRESGHSAPYTYTPTTTGVPTMWGPINVLITPGPPVR